MLPLSGRVPGLLRALLRRLPLSDYQKTRLWATCLPRPLGPVKGWPYHRCVELAARALATPEGYGVAFPGAGNPESAFSMLEFGVGNGNGFQLMLHFRDVWLKRLNIRSKVIGVGFDSFEGMPPARPGDAGLPWKERDLPSELHSLQAHLQSNFSDFHLVKGYFRDTLKEYGRFLRDHPPVFVSIDCDYYSSTMDVFEHLLPDVALHGCLFYFDDVGINFWCEKTGELRAIAEVNAGRFGSHICLVEYPLWIETREMRHYKQVYRLFNLETAEKQQRSRPHRVLRQAPRSVRLSPL